MSALKFPIDAAIAAKAYRLQKSGLKGKATAEKLGKDFTTDDANLMAAVGRDDARDQESVFTENEAKVLVALLQLQRERTRMGETSSPKAWMLRRGTGLSDSQIRRATKRLNENGYGERGKYGLLHHSVNGHIWLNAVGIAVADAMLAERAKGGPA